MKNESTLRWLLCDLQLREKTLVRHGIRKEIPTGDKWVFCPLRASPRDRISIKNCEKCNHFKGYRKIEITQKVSDSLIKDFKPMKQHGGNPKRITTISINNNDLDELDKKQKEWEKKEKDLK